MSLRVIILAAGNGKRMASDRPKVLHTIGGVSMLEHVVCTAQQLKPQGIYIIYGSGGETVPESLSHLSDVEWVYQEEQLGTGHAVLQALPQCKAKDRVLVLYGDVPLISVRTLQELLHETTEHGLGLVVTEVEDPTGFGRIVRNEMGNIVAIVEERDASAAQRKIKEINTGIMTASAAHLKAWLPALKNDNKQQEYYLTDIVSQSVGEGVSVGGVMAHCREEVQGVNDRWQQTVLERYYQKRQAQQLSYAGVAIADPERLEVRGCIKAGRDVFIDINVILEGNVEIGDGCYIGANVILKEVTIGANTEILPNSMVEDAKIGSSCRVGPFARVRPGTVLHDGAKIGNFVEIKKSTIGKNSKINHLSYMGDATVGQNVNVGAGTITCNYDGENKWSTQIDDNAFIGSNTSLLAPVSVGKNAVIAAGSVINKDAPADALTLSLRLTQRSQKNWKKKKPVSEVATNSEEKNSD